MTLALAAGPAAGPVDAEPAPPTPTRARLDALDQAIVALIAERRAAAAALYQARVTAGAPCYCHAEMSATTATYQRVLGVGRGGEIARAILY